MSLEDQLRTQELVKSLKLKVASCSPVAQFDLVAHVPSVVIPAYINMLFICTQGEKKLAEISGLIGYSGDNVSFKAQNSDNFSSIYNSNSPYYISFPIQRLVESMIKQLLLNKVVSFWIPCSIQSEGAKKMYSRIYSDPLFMTEVDPIFLLRGIRLKNRN